MITGNLIIASFLTSIVLAAIGARLAGAEPWKGAALGVAYVAATLLTGLFTTSVLLALIAGLVAVGIVAGPLGILSKQSMNIALGCIIGQWAPILFVAG